MAFTTKGRTPFPPQKALSSLMWTKQHKRALFLDGRTREAAPVVCAWTSYYFRGKIRWKLSKYLASHKVLIFIFFWYKVSYGPGWPGTSHVVQDLLPCSPLPCAEIPRMCHHTRFVQQDGPPRALSGLGKYSSVWTMPPVLSHTFKKKLIAWSISDKCLQCISHDSITKGN